MLFRSAPTTPDIACWFCGMRIAVSPMAACFYRALVDGATLGQALDAATSVGDPQGFDLADALSLLIRHGALVAWPRTAGVEP